MSITPRSRAGLFVDGFNLYHAIDDIGKPYLKWLSLRTLAERVGKPFGVEFVELNFCTAFFPGDFGKQKRHEAYVNALAAEGVNVIFGHTIKEPMDCRSCGHIWHQPREKETDINVALSLFEAASRIDIAFLVTADTDQAATLRYMAKHYPEKKVVVLTPPGRPVSSHLRDLAFKNIRLSETDIDLSILPDMITPPGGRLVVRPSEYTPPLGWVHPTKRP